MKKLLSVIVLCACSNFAHAGIWDSISGFFGGGEKTETKQEEVRQEETKQEVVVAEKVSEPTTKSKLIETGVQLLPLLIQTLGVTDGQAQGGMGAILQAAGGLLSKTEYGSLLSAIPGANGLLSAAPAVPTADTGSMKNKLIGGALEAAGKSGGALQQGANLVAQFNSLGLGADMIPKFSNVAGDFLKTTDKPEAGNLLTGAISQLQGLKL